jgi:hypothetical protein
VAEQEQERRAQAHRTLAIKIAAKQHGWNPAALEAAVGYVEDVAANPYTDDEFEALQ